MLPQSAIQSAPPAAVHKAVPPEEQAIIKNEQYSVRQFSPNSWGGFIGDSMGWIFPSTRGLMGMWGTLECDQLLRAFHYREMNGLWGGASKVWIEKFLGTPYEISGGRNQTYQWQDIFFEADFGEGYDYMMSKFLLDYLTLNRGAFLEKVGYGASDTPLYDESKVIGLNHLDALRIYFTGNREYPYLYQSEWTGGLHKLHYSRVIRVAAQPSANTLMFGMGKSALYDSLLVANAQTLIGTQQNELLNDMPPPGIVLFNNVRPDEVEAAMKQFRYDNIKDGNNIYRAPVKLSSFDSQNPATVTFIPVRTLPPDYDFEKYTLTNVNILALTTGLDPQDIWPLQTKVMGSGMQSQVLNEKSEARGPGYLLTKMERTWNTLIPRALTWKYKAQNTQQDKQIADTAKQWNDLAENASYLNANEKRQLMVNQVPAIAEVIADEQGVARLFDDDPKTSEQITSNDVMELDTPELGAQDITGQDNTPMNNTTQGDQPGTDSEPPSVTPKKAVVKDIDETGNAYVDDILTTIKDAQAGSITKAGAASRIRGAIIRYGKLAYQDGLEEGGVDPSELDEDDKLRIADYNVWDSTYVTDFVDELYSPAGLKGTPEARAGLWISTLNRFYYGGIESADKNGMYKFVGDDGVENCKTCHDLKGQVHRMKDWVRHELRPGIDHHNFECGTWEPNCAHYLEKTEERAKGSWA